MVVSIKENMFVMVALPKRESGVRMKGWDGSDG